jgi:hypothetical protein
MNSPDHFFRQAANCACCAAFVKGADSIKKKQTIGTRLALYKGCSTGLPLAWR